MILINMKQHQKKRYYIQGIPEMELSANSGKWNSMFDDDNKPTKIIINYAPFSNETFPPNDNDEIVIEHPWHYKPVLTIDGSKNVVFDGFQIKYGAFLCPSIPNPCDGYNAAFLTSTKIPGGVYMTNTNNVTIKNCIISHFGSAAISVTKAVDSDISYNNISDFGAGGIYFNGGSDNTMISDNRIFDGATIISQGSGIGGSSSHVTVQYNELTRLVGSGTNIFSSPYLIVNKNHVHHNGRSDGYGISDFGGLYFTFDNNGCCTPQITNNKVHDIISVVYGANGIYLDYGSSDMYVYGNLVYNVAGWTFCRNYNSGEPEEPPVIIKNNIFVTTGPGSNDCPDSFIIPSTTFNQGLSWNTEPPKNDNGSFINNINFLIKVDGYQLFSTYNGDESWFKHSKFDYNIYYVVNDSQDHNVYFPGKSSGESNRVDLKQWQSDTNQDIHSKLEDPLFVDYKQCNFDLQESSPAFKDINFQPLNVSDVGPRYHLK